jgi:uncharacterized protein YjbJ (UPF0337 family)
MDSMGDANTNDTGNAKEAVKKTVANFTGDKDTQVKATPDKVNAAVRPKVDGAKDAEGEMQDMAERKANPMHEKGW